MNSNLNYFVVVSLVTLGITGCVKPKLTNMKVCEALETTGNCQIDTNIFQNKKQKFFVTADLENVKGNTPIKFVFTFLPTQGSLANTEVPLTSNTIMTKSSDKFVVTSITPPSAGWQTGKYRVEFVLAPDVKYNREFIITPITPFTP